MKNYYYTYLLIGLDHRLYIGVRSCDCLPEEDKYRGSFTDKTFVPISKHIQEIFTNGSEALDHEILLHKEFNVGTNNLFANRACSTNNGFLFTGARTEEHKRKISEATKGRKMSEEQKQLLSKINKGFKALHSKF